MYSHSVRDQRQPPTAQSVSIQFTVMSSPHWKESSRSHVHIKAHNIGIALSYDPATMLW